MDGNELCKLVHCICLSVCVQASKEQMRGRGQYGHALNKPYCDNKL